MKHGRRHMTLKEQAYVARKDAEGYGRPYRAIDVAEPTGEHVAPEPEPTTLADRLKGNQRKKKQMSRAGIDLDE